MKKTRNQRVALRLYPELLLSIAKLRQQQGWRSRTRAIEVLLQAGIDQYKSKPPATVRAA